MQNQQYQPQEPPPRKNKISAPIIILVAVIGVCGLSVILGGIGGAIFFLNTNDSATSNTKSTETSSKETPANLPPEPKKASAGITIENFNKIKTGMAYEKVVEILGEEGTVISENEVSGYRTIVYQWKAGAMTNMSCIFQNEKLISKTQFGL